MEIIPSLSQQQNFAIWGFLSGLATFLVVMVLVAVVGGIQRRQATGTTPVASDQPPDHH